MEQMEISKILRKGAHDDCSLLFPTKSGQKEWLNHIKTNAEYESILNEIQEEAKRLLHESENELSYSLFKQFSETGSRLEYEKKYFAKRRRLITFALAVLLEEDNTAYLEGLHNIIWSICNEYTWCLPAHLNIKSVVSVDSYSLDEKTNPCFIDLFASETAFALSEILKLIGQSLDPLIKKRIREEVYRRVFIPYVKHPGLEWETATHNWAAVCAGSIGSAALHLMDDDVELSHIIQRVLQTMNYYLKGFYNDGTCLEGYGYWEYGFGFYVYFADLLKKRTSGMINLFELDKVHEIALFQQKIFLDHDRVVNFSDSPSRATVFLGLSHYLNKIYDDFELPRRELRAHFTDDHCNRWAPAFRNILWFDKNAIGKPWQEATYYLNESQWFISRYYSKSGRYAFAAKGGHNNEPHNHNDVGHFILYGNGETFLKDLGRGLYNEAYFNEERYSFLCNGSHGHSVPIINGQYQQNSKQPATVKKVSANIEDETFELDISHAYHQEDLGSLTRTLTWMKVEKPRLTLEDTYRFTAKPNSIVERLITPDFSIIQEENGIVLKGEHKLRILFDRKQLSFKVNRFEFQNHHGEIEENLALDFTVLNPRKECSVKFIFQFE